MPEAWLNVDREIFKDFPRNKIQALFYVYNLPLEDFVGSGFLSCAFSLSSPLNNYKSMTLTHRIDSVCNGRAYVDERWNL